MLDEADAATKGSAELQMFENEVCDYVICDDVLDTLLLEVDDDEVVFLRLAAIESELVVDEMVEIVRLTDVNDATQQRVEVVDDDDDIIAALVIMVVAELDEL